MFSIIEIPGKKEQFDVFEAGLILPVPGREKNSILMEPRDGGGIQRLTAKAVTFTTGGKTVFRDSNVRIDLFVTDARFALACSNYDKGGGWFGSLGLMLLANTLSKIRAAVRSHGKILGGQVRYPWLARVGSSPKKGWGSDEKLYLEANGAGGGGRITLTLPKNIIAAKVAAEIARRAAAYRLAVETPTTEVAESLNRLRVAQEQPSGKANEVHWFVMPSPHKVDEESARWQPGAGYAAPAAMYAAPPPAAIAPPPAPAYAAPPAALPAAPAVYLPPPEEPIAAAPQSAKACRQPTCTELNLPTTDNFCSQCGVPTQATG